MIRIESFNERFKRFLAVLFFTAVILIHVQAAPGDLDPTFGNAGRVRQAFGGGDERINALAFQTDGKIVAAGYAQNGSNQQFMLIRYNADGSLDPTFGDGGKVYTRVGVGSSEAHAVIVQPDGKIVAAGEGYGNNTEREDFAIVRYNADGSLDAPFGSGGKIMTDFFDDADRVNAVGLLTNGRILVVGGARANFSNGYFALARYNPDGSPDTTFSGGKVAINTANLYEAHSLAFVSSEKFVVAGSARDGSFYDLALARFNANGALDATFDGDGVVVTDIPSGEKVSLGIQSSLTQPEKIVAATHNNLVRYVAANGALDTTFDGNGILSTGSGVNTGLIIQSNVGEATRIVVSGYAGSGGSDFRISRYLLSGAPDTAFGSGGTVLTPIGAGSDVSTAMRARSGKIYVAGYAYTDSFYNSDSAIAAFNSTNGAIDTTFNQNGKRVDDFGSPSATANGTAVQADGKIVVVGTNGGGGFAVMRFGSAGALDASFSGDGKTVNAVHTAGGSSSASDAAIQADGKIVVAGNADGHFAAVRYHADGSLDASFGTGGAVKTPFGISSSVSAAAIQADGKIVLAGTVNDGSNNSDDFAVVRYLTSGALDASFAAGGKLRVGVGLINDSATSVKIQTDGKIVVGGATKVGETLDFSLVRINPNGALDTNFGSFGKLLTDMGDADAITEIEMQTDGKIVAVGYTTDFSIFRIAAARYLPNGTLDSSFDGDGKVITQINLVFDAALDAAIQADGKILVAGYGGDGSSAVFVAARYTPTGALDATYGAGGKVIVDVSGGDDFGYALALDAAGKAVIAGEADGFFGIVRLLGDFDPTAATVSVGGRVTTEGKGIRNIRVTLTDASGAARSTQTGAFGAYRFADVPAGATYIVSVSGKRFRFAEPTRIVSVFEQLDDLNFVGTEQW